MPALSPHILHLPMELLDSIVLYTPTLRDISALARTSRQFYTQLTPALLSLAAALPVDLTGNYATRPVLCWAAAHNRAPLIRSLLAHGAELAPTQTPPPSEEPPTEEYDSIFRVAPRRPSPCPEDVTPLFSALAQNHGEVVTVLLEHGAKLGMFVERLGLPVIHTAILLGFTDLKRIGNVEARTAKGEVPALHYAVMVRSVSAIRALKEMGAELEAEDSVGCKALEYALMLGASEEAEALIALGAKDVGKVEQSSKVPPWWAAIAEEIAYLQKKEWVCRCCVECGGEGSLCEQEATAKAEDPDDEEEIETEKVEAVKKVGKAEEKDA